MSVPGIGTVMATDPLPFMPSEHYERLPSNVIDVVKSSKFVTEHSPKYFPLFPEYSKLCAPANLPTA